MDVVGARERSQATRGEEEVAPDLRRAAHDAKTGRDGSIVRLDAAPPRGAQISRIVVPRASAHAVKFAAVDEIRGTAAGQSFAPAVGDDLPDISRHVAKPK